MGKHKNINDWNEFDDPDVSYFRTGQEGFDFTVTDGVITLCNNGDSVSLNSVEISRVGFRRMYCDELIGRFFEKNMALTTE